MKSYKGSSNNHNTEPHDIKRKRVVYGILIGIALVIVALAITLSVVFTRPQASIPVDNTPVITEPDPEPPVVVEPVYVVPVEGGIIREAALDKLVYMPSLNMWKTHKGVDFEAAEGAKVVAFTDGTIKSVQETTLEGYVVTVEHDGGLVSVYKSLSKATVKAGDKVSAGSEIGKAGTMLVESSDGVHVHFELIKSGKHIDPLSYVDAEIIK